MFQSSSPALDANEFENLRRSFHELRVERIIEETSDAKSLVFEIPNHLREVFAYQAGQFLTLQINYNQTQLKRCYSLASSPLTDQEHKVTVKRVANGRISNWIHDHVQEGDKLSVLPPEGRFVLPADHGPLVLFGGGSGITPLISILKTALHTSKGSIALVYANRDQASIIFQTELEELCKQHAERLTIHHHLDSLYGFMQTKQVTPFTTNFDAHYFLCGPDPFMTMVEQSLMTNNVPSSHVHVERFVSPADPGTLSQTSEATVPNTSDVPATMTVDLEGNIYEVPYKPGLTLLEAALAANIDAPYSCKEGFCGCCAAKLMEGEVVMDADDALTSQAKKEGLILTCQARPSCPKKLSFKFVEYLTKTSPIRGHHGNNES
jgi:3-ketosteroid 9alpha-monooxygenase subunit B